MPRLAQERSEEPYAVALDSRTLRSTPQSGGRATWDGHKCTRGSKPHLAVDTLGHLPSLCVMPANADDRTCVAALADAGQDAIGESVDRVLRGLETGDQLRVLTTDHAAVADFRAF